MLSNYIDIGIVFNKYKYEMKVSNYIVWKSTALKISMINDYLVVYFKNHVEIWNYKSIGKVIQMISAINIHCHDGIYNFITVHDSESENVFSQLKMAEENFPLITSG
jgi:hypothetical protein